MCSCSERKERERETDSSWEEIGDDYGVSMDIDRRTDKREMVKRDRNGG